MKLYKSDSIKFISGLIFIIIIYSWYYLYFMNDVGSWKSYSNLAFHLIRFTTTIAVYFVGTFHLGKLKDSWMSSLWHLVHISGLIIITSMGLFDYFILEISRNLKEFAHTVQEILISPVLYVAMGLLNKSLKRGSQV